MRMVTQICIDGVFVTPHGTEMLDLFDQVPGEVIGQDRLADNEDARRAIQTAKRASPTYARAGQAKRLELLRTPLEAETR
jgi:aldehyde dehydrogenase (NAD+)